MSFTESDWKHLRGVHRVALERFCSRVLDECSTILGDPNASAHDRYLRIYRVLRERDRELSLAFDDMRRSTAMQRLLAMLALDVVTAAEFSRFSDSVRETAAALGRTPTE